MKLRKAFIVLLIIGQIPLASHLYAQTEKENIENRVDSLIRLMTLEEKIGQLNQVSNDKKHTGPVIKDTNQLEEIKKGNIGSMLNVVTPERSRQYQEIAMQSRLKIPLLFGLDVVHGMKTIFPIPLAEAASFDLELMERTAATAAHEAAAHGVHWTFAPMVDIGRDARWGRVMEGAGEDTWYGSEVAKARIKGFQGDHLNSDRTILACAKHFAAYGAAISGKDYNSVEISDNTLHQVYLPPFKAAVEVRVATFMNSFNDIHGVPATASKYLQKDILKGKWEFEGFIVSDWNSIGELIPHRVAANKKEAAAMAINGGNDMDMVSLCYRQNLKGLVETGVVKEEVIDEAVKRVLMKKFELGLFDDPFLYGKQEAVYADLNRELAYEAAVKSIVLLKNRNNVLPISSSLHSIALVGPLMNSQIDMLGGWAAEGEAEKVVTVYEGIKNTLPEVSVNYIEGYDLQNNELKPLPILDNYDLIIVAVGERASESGEAKSKTDININANQQQLVKELKATEKPVIALVMGGRPLIFSEMEPYTDAILMTWWLGHEAGNGIAAVLCGNYNPSGKLPMTFPAHAGQCPIYYNHKSTGRPWSPGSNFTAGYIDASNLPAYAFGYGLSYSEFRISPPQMKKTFYSREEEIIVSVEIENRGKYKGTETVQLYLQDVVSSITRPVIELCGYRQVTLAPGEKQHIEFKLRENDLGFFNQENEFVTESGTFKLFVGNSSDNLQETSFELTD